MFHVDTPSNTTTAGTKLDADTRWAKAYTEGCDLISKCIEKIASQFEVEVKVVSGNHDETKCFYMGSYLTAWFKNHKNVHIDNEPTRRKYFGFGKNLIGFTHGNDAKLEDLPLILMRENQRFCF